MPAVVAVRPRRQHWSNPMTDSARLLGAKRGFNARLSGDGSYEGQCRCAFLLCRQENISKRTPRLSRRAVLCRLCNEISEPKAASFCIYQENQSVTEMEA